MVCSGCGHFQPDSAGFCGYCGACLIRTDYRQVWGGKRAGVLDAVADVWVVALLVTGCTVLAGSMVVRFMLLV